MKEPTDSQMALMFSFYEGVFRKGPGGEASTRKALSMLDGLPPNPRIVDFGCGAGAASLVLANAIECSVTAVDIHQPFLKELDAFAAREGLSDRITTVQADMADPTFPDGSFDLIWSEGAIYNVGFQEGLKLWRRLLRSGGLVAITEVTWLCETPPQKAGDFWQAEYPAITNIADNLAKVRSAGFEGVGHFILPSEDWQNYYGPVQEQLVAFRSKHAANKEAQALADSVQEEIDVWRECGTSYGYVFYLGRVI
jgi:ubiquinone/menaquinone biosynthesis C-methylase UbiE